MCFLRLEKPGKVHPLEVGMNDLSQAPGYCELPSYVTHHEEADLGPKNLGHLHETLKVTPKR